MPATRNHIPIKLAKCINCRYYVKRKQYCQLKQDDTKSYMVCLKHEFMEEGDK